MGRIRRFFELLSGRSRRPQRLLQGFLRHRQELQDRCISMAAAEGKPRGLRWKNAEWLDTFALVEDSSNGLLTLFCGVNLSFEAVAGGDMEDVEAVSLIRDATAVFHCQEERWGTGGRILFNMSPQMASAVVATGQRLLLSRDGQVPQGD